MNNTTSHDKILLARTQQLTSSQLINENKLLKSRLGNLFNSEVTRDASLETTSIVCWE